MTETDRLTRTLSLSLEAGAPPAATPLPSRPAGILDLRFDPHGGNITVTYDLRHVTIPALEAWLAASGLPLSKSLPSRLRRRWLAFKDDNRRDQAAIVHQCCSVPPAKD